LNWNNFTEFYAELQGVLEALEEPISMETTTVGVRRCAEDEVNFFVDTEDGWLFNVAIFSHAINLDVEACYSLLNLASNNVSMPYELFGVDV